MNEPRPQHIKATPGAAAPRILVVEDEAPLALLLSYNLEAEGFIVERVERGDEAELRLTEDPADLVILDWMLPGVSGLEICRRLRAREATKTLPVIMLTARGEESGASIRARAGAPSLAKCPPNDSSAAAGQPTADWRAFVTHSG